MSRQELILKQQIFEAKYKRGYVYLDRCGETMLALEDVLQQQTKHIWMPAEMVPTGARINCPDLDITIVFDPNRFVIDRQPTADIECDFIEIIQSAFSIIKNRFYIKDITRYGHRQICFVPTDSMDEADELSTKRSIYKDVKYPNANNSNMAVRSIATTIGYESEDNSKGITIRINPFNKAEAPESIDERLNISPRLLYEGQREALAEQLKRRRSRTNNPDAGLLIDLDYYHYHPPSELAVVDFFVESSAEIDCLKRNLKDKR